MEKDVWDIRLFLFVRKVIWEEILACKEEKAINLHVAIRNIF